jgi:alpha-beta hydrolase superfamily lysophospholipase
MAEYIANAQFEVHLIDLRGFGNSSGVPGDATIQTMHKDLEILLKHVNQEIPLFIMGHSMGSGVVNSLLEINPNLKIRGVIVQSAFLRLRGSENFTFLQKVAFRIMSNMLGVIN